jgi:hypothetical protein
MSGSEWVGRSVAKGTDRLHFSAYATNSLFLLVRPLGSGETAGFVSAKRSLQKQPQQLVHL